MRYLRLLLGPLGVLGLLLGLLGLSPLAADHRQLSLTPVADLPLPPVPLRHGLPDHPGPEDAGQPASTAQACDKDLDLTSTLAGVISVAAQDNLICTSADIDTYVAQDGKTLVVQAGGEDAAWVHSDVSNPSSPVCIANWEWSGGAGANTYTPDVKAFKQDGRDYIALALERQTLNAFCGVAVMDVTDPLNPVLAGGQQFIGVDWCDVHNVFVETDSSGDGAFIYATADNTQDLRVLEINSDLTACDYDAETAAPDCLVELGKYRRTDRGSEKLVHDVTVVDGKVYASYWQAGLDMFDAALIKVPGATVGETNPGVVNVTPPLFNGTPFLVHHAFPSGGSHVFIQDEITFESGFEPVQMWTTSSTPTYVDGIELGGSGAADVPFVLPAHNLEVRDDLDLDGDSSPDDRLYVGWYKAGLQAFDFNDSGFTARRMYHQVQTESADDAYEGAWGVRLATIGMDTYVVQSDRRYGLIIDQVDICSALANPGQPDTDGDGVIDSCDDDIDGDGWSNAAETFLTTDPNLACAPNGWPPDPRPAPDGNGVVQIDDVTFAASAFGSTTTPRAEIASQDGAVQIDDVSSFASRFGQAC